MVVPKPVPTLRGEERIYFEEAKAGRLVYQRCDDCGEAIFYPRVACPYCLSESLSFVPASGRGNVYSFTTLHRAGHPSFADDVPYTVVLVDLEEGVRVLADLVDPPEDAVAVRVGAPVEVVFEERTEDFTLPRFRLVPTGAEG